MAEIKRTSQDSPTEVNIQVKQPDTDPSEVVEEVKLTNDKKEEEFHIPNLEEINKMLADEETLKKMKEEELAAIDVIKEAQNIEDYTQDELKAYNERVNNRISKIKDSTYETLVDNIISQSNVPYEQRIAVKRELLNKLKTEQAISEEVQEAQNEFEETFKKLELEMDNMFTNMKYIDLLEKISGLIEIAKKHNQGKAVQHYSKLYEEVDTILHLTRLKNYLPKFKNPTYLVDKCTSEEDYNRDYMKFFHMLEYSKEYQFVDPSKLRECLEASFPEERKSDASLFMFSLFRYMIDTTKSLEKNAVFLEGLFRIIYTLHLPEENSHQKLDDEEKKEFLNSMNEYLDGLKKLAEEHRVFIANKEKKNSKKKK